MANHSIAAIDVGTTKICTIVAEVDQHQDLRILGVGVGPSAGLARGMVDNIQAGIEAIASSKVASAVPIRSSAAAWIARI